MLLQTIKLYDIRVKAAAQGSGAVPTINSGSTMVNPPPPLTPFFLPLPSPPDLRRLIAPFQVTKLAVCAMQPRWLASCSDDGIVKVWDVAMPSEPITSASTGSKTVTDLSFHPQRRGDAHSIFESCVVTTFAGLLLAALRAEQRVEIFDISLAPLSGGESVSTAPWRSYDVAEEVSIAFLFLIHCDRLILLLPGCGGLLAAAVRCFPPLCSALHDEWFVSIHPHSPGAGVWRARLFAHVACALAFDV
jgi:WD40 repeat protein